MNAARDLGEVIVHIIAELNPVQHPRLIRRLQSVRDSAGYAPPEGQHIWWKEARNALMAELGDPPRDLPLATRVQAIFAGR